MAINSVLQTIRNAEIDARSLSEFIFNPADAMVSRRLAPSIHTLNYYLRFFDGAVISATEDANKIKQQALGTVSYIENTIRDAIDTTVIENSPVSDALVSVDGSLSQRTINKGLESIADLSTIKNPKDGLRVYVKSYHAGLGKGGGYFTYDSSMSEVNDRGSVINGWVRSFPVSNEASIDDFGGDVASAGEWVKTNINNICKLVAGETYTISQSGEVYLNRLICEGGRATIIVPAETTLSFDDGSDKGSILLKGLNIIVLGNREGPDTATSSTLYKRITTPVHNLDICDVDLYGLLDASNLDSWNDSANKTRTKFFMAAIVNNYSVVRNVNVFGFCGFLNLAANNVESTHSEENVHGYNCETLFYLPKLNEWLKGYSSNLSITNTDEQKIYWRGQNKGRVANGLDILMCEADHSQGYIVRDVKGIGVIERSVYMQSNNAEMHNIEDSGSNTMLGTKIDHTGIVSGSYARVHNAKGSSLTTNSVAMQLYGYDSYDIYDTNISYPTRMPNIRAIGFTNCNNLNLKGGFLKNIGVPFYLVGTERVESIRISDFELVDCGTLNAANLWERRDTATVGTLEISNVQYKYTDLAEASSNISFNGSTFTDIDIVKLKNVSTYAIATPFANANVGYMEVMNCNFTVVRPQGVDVLWAQIDLYGGGNSFKANVFDFTVNFIPYEAVPKVGRMSATFRKLRDTGVVNCKNYWKEIVYEQPVGTASMLKVADILDTPFECKVTMGNAVMRMNYDPSTGQLTESLNIGNSLSSTSQVDKVSVYVDSGYLWVRVQTGTWIGTNETVSVVCTR